VISKQLNNDNLMAYTTVSRKRPRKTKLPLFANGRNSHARNIIGTVGRYEECLILGYKKNSSYLIGHTLGLRYRAQPIYSI
jgi:hypothetical protein